MNMIPSFTVEMDIEDVLYLSYLVPVERLRPCVPPSLPFAFTEGGGTVFSVVMFRSGNVGASFFPFLRFAYDQANIRTYVIDPATGKPGVFFLKSGITSRLVSTATAVLGIPWQFVPMGVSAEYDEGSLRGYTAEGRWDGDFRLSLAEREGPGEDTVFATLDNAARSITGPATGFYGLASGLIRFEVKHSVVEPLAAGISRMEFPLLERLGFLREDEFGAPLNALVAKKAHFTVFMPPQRIPLSG